ncbi:gamma subclass chorismate mutase AroQ [Synechococcus sp. CS-1328]|uniref:gamma subclass chorismate mutase AroQ n=1 Tax=Synechococcus sp. CS-1328 TaxID=2847976 RepID=UPI00223AF7C3|nr:gamma subclass chorismate mutase AroQ [Synechococcus sp. CS-1328]MCT0224242.1 gamma subclass chorismate mutase AroQ [Synechococcus sp. CS-1328]
MSITPHQRRQFVRLDWWLRVLLVTVITCGCSSSVSANSTDTTTVYRLLLLIRDRLEVAPEVARTKWNTKAPIEDLPREKLIIYKVIKGATNDGLEPKLAEIFLTGQIEASKIVQKELHAEWAAKRQPPFPSVADLGRDIRPVLDRLTPAMMRQLAQALPILRRPGGRQLLDLQVKTVLGHSPWSEKATQAAVAPLLKLSR